MGRHGTAGGQAGQHRPPHTGHDFGHRHPQPGDRRSAVVPGDQRHLQQLLELEHSLPGGCVVHHRLEHLQGGLQQRVPASREHDLQLAGRAVQLQLHLDGAHRHHLPSRPAHRQSRRQSRHGDLRAGQMDDGTMDAVGGDPPRLLQEQLPGAVDRRHVLRTESERSVRQDRQPQLERRHAADSAPPTTSSATARRRSRSRSTSTSKGSGQPGSEPRRRRMHPIPSIGSRTRHRASGPTQRRLHPAMRPEQLRGQRRVPGGGQPQLRHRPAGNDLRSGFDDGLGQTGVQLGVHHERPAGNHSQDVARGAVRAPVVRQHPPHGRPLRFSCGLHAVHVHGAVGPAAAERRRLHADRHGAESNGGAAELLRHAGEQLRQGRPSTSTG